MIVSDDIANDRAYALTLARRYFYDRSIELDTVMETFAETTDPLIDDLLDLMVHEPARTGVITVSQRDYEKNYWPRVAAVLTELNKGAAGVLPPEPEVRLRRLFWIALLTIFIGASAAERLRDFVWHLTGRQTQHVGLAALDLFFGLVLSLFTIALIVAFVGTFRLYLSQRRGRNREV